MANSIVNTGIINNFVKKPKNLTQYTAFRGVTDFTQVGQFNQFETGYSFLSVIKMPKFMEMLASQDANIATVVNNFTHMLEYEFRGLSGLPDISGETYSITDGINDLNMISKVTSDTSITVSSPYFEKTGSLITRFSELYLSGIKDPKSQAKTYHGLIKHGLLEPSLENEVFTMLYYVTDNTMLELERAVLLTNCQLTKAETSMYDATKGDISNKELTIEWNCFPVTGYEVDKAAKALLQDITGVSVIVIDSAGNVSRSVVKTDGVAALDSANYRYGIMDADSGAAIPELVNAINKY